HHPLNPPHYTLSLHDALPILKSFIDEARIASQLHHSNVVGVLDFGLMDGALFQALEFVEGMDLEALLERASASSHRVTEEVALQDRKSTRLNSSHRTISYAVF